MITDRNKLNFVTIQWLWFVCLILVWCSGTTTLAHNVETTQQQQQQQQLQQLAQQQTQAQAQHQTLSQQQSTLQLPQSQSHLQPQQVESNGPPQQDVTVRNFSPRMDYNSNEWRPVGRGDPLKNDPTFDYSPPTLDRVRYWADPDKDKDKTEEVSAAIIDAKLKKANPGKNEILLLGVTGDRMRGTPVIQHPQHVQHAPQHMQKNAKGETPLLQPKYTSIRRSYYAHQLPTHLMPPPMQPMMPAMQQQQPLQQSGQQAVGHVMMKPAHTEYRHNMPHSYMSSSPQMGSAMNGHSSKPTYHMSSPSTQPWVQHSSMVTSMPSHHMKAQAPQHYSHPNPNPHTHAHDTHHQESVNYLTYTRPSMSSTPGHDYYSPNSIRGGSAAVHKSGSSRKPWIHDLLQKEFIKTMKPTLSPNSYHTEPPARQPQMESHFEPMLPPTTTYAPVTFVTPTTAPATTQSAAVYITSSSTTYHTTASPPVYTQATTTTQAPRTTTTLSPTRLLIPNTSNLSYRPTVTPMKMTTDSLFSHYNQPEKPLRGPMYLIIEGHSKVKTYGKDELDPHKPKIVPVISNREPVVRRADPNEKRGTPETFQVKHLHTITTQPMEKPTTATSKMAASTTTKKPVVVTSTAKSSTTVKPTTAKPKTTTKKMVATTPAIIPKKATATTPATPTTPKKVASSTTTTAKPATKAAPKISVTTTSTTAKPKAEKSPSPKEDKIPSKSPVKGDKVSPNNLNSLNIAQKPSQALITEPPTAMQGFLSLLDSSLDTLFKQDANTAPAGPAANGEKKESATTTKLKSINMNTQPQIEARVSTKLQAIKAEDYDDDDDDAQFLKATTEYLPRETRQIFDYDQRPESRITTNYDELIDSLGEEEDLSALGFDDEYEDDEEAEADELESPNNQQLIKRIDSLVSSTEDLEDLDDDLEEDGDDLEALDLARQQKAKKA